MEVMIAGISETEGMMVSSLRWVGILVYSLEGVG